MRKKRTTQGLTSSGASGADGDGASSVSEEEGSSIEQKAGNRRDSHRTGSVRASGPRPSPGAPGAAVLAPMRVYIGAGNAPGEKSPSMTISASGSV